MCTDFLVAPSQGDPSYCVAARSLEGTPMGSQITFRAAGKEFIQAADTDAMSWDIKGLTALSPDGETKIVIEGMNNQGLTTGGLWLLNFTAYPLKPQQTQRVEVRYLVDYILGNFASIDDLSDAINNRNISPQVQLWGDGTDGTLYPCHFPIHDAKGNSVVIEFLNGEMCFLPNPSAVCTNAPPLAWQLTNLGNYGLLTPVPPSPVAVGDTIQVKGTGGGMAGIPGNSWPASRFVRTYFNLKFAMENKAPASADEAVKLAFHLMNMNDIPLGVSQANPTNTDPPTVEYDKTLWVVVKDLKNFQFYVRDYNALSVSVIDLKTVAWEQLNQVCIDIPAKNAIPFVSLVRVNYGLSLNILLAFGQVFSLIIY